MKNRKKKRSIALFLIVFLTLSPCLPFLQGSMLAQAASFTIQMKGRMSMLGDVSFDFFGERMGSGIYYWMKDDGSPLLCVQQHTRLGTSLNGAEAPEEISSGTYFTSDQYELVSLVLQCCGMLRGEDGTLEAGDYLAAQAAVWGILSPNWLGTEQLKQEMEVLYRHVCSWNGISVKELKARATEMIEIICQTIEENHGDTSRYIPSFASKYEENAPIWQAQWQEDGTCQVVFERGDRAEAIKDYRFRLPDGWTYRWDGDQIVFSCERPKNEMVAVAGTAMEGSLLSEAMPIGLIYIAWASEYPEYQHLASGVDVTVPLSCYLKIYIPPRPEDLGSWHLPGGELYRHQEEFTALYGVELEKTDGDTGVPLEGVEFQILEYFDAAQLDGTILDKEQLETWDGWKARCEKQLTGYEGRLTHWDKKVYHFEKTYCGGHPDPEILYEGSSERMREQLEEEAWEAWEAAVAACREICDHHAVDGSGKDALEAERDLAYGHFTGLAYGYTFEETEPLKGYHPYGNGGTDPVQSPLRIFCVSVQAGGRHWEEAEPKASVLGEGKEDGLVPDGQLVRSVNGVSRVMMTSVGTADEMEGEKGPEVSGEPTQTDGADEPEVQDPSDRVDEPKVQDPSDRVDEPKGTELSDGTNVLEGADLSGGTDGLERQDPPDGEDGLEGYAPPSDTADGLEGEGGLAGPEEPGGQEGTGGQKSAEEQEGAEGREDPESKGGAEGQEGQSGQGSAEDQGGTDGQGGVESQEDQKDREGSDAPEDMATGSDALSAEMDEADGSLGGPQKGAQRRWVVWLTSLVEPLGSVEITGATFYCFFVENYRIGPPKESEPGESVPEEDPMEESLPEESLPEERPPEESLPEESEPEESQMEGTGPIMVLPPDGPRESGRGEVPLPEPTLSVPEDPVPRIGWIEASYTPLSTLLIGDEDTPRSGRSMDGKLEGGLPGTGDQGADRTWLLIVMAGAALTAAGIWHRKKQLLLCALLVPLFSAAAVTEARAAEEEQTSERAELVLYLPIEEGTTPQEYYLDGQGQRYVLYLYRQVEEEIPEEQRPIAETRIYRGLEDNSQIPELFTVGQQDGAYGRIGSGDLEKSSAAEIGSYWVDDLTIPIIFHAYDADQFELEGITVQKEDALQGLLKEQEAFLESLGCDPGRYEICEIVWDGESYMEQGVLCRRAQATGRKRLTDHQVDYEGTILYPAATEKKWEARYLLSPGLDQPLEEETQEETLVVLEEPVPEASAAAPEPIAESAHQGSFWKAVRTFAAYTVSIAVLLPVLLFLVAAWRKRRRSGHCPREYPARRFL